MRAREFTINIPINVKINDDDEIDVSTKDEVKPLVSTLKKVKKSNVVNKDEPTDDLATNFVPPLQQKIEIMKHAAGKESDVIDQIIADEDTPAA